MSTQLNLLWFVFWIKGKRYDFVFASRLYMSWATMYEPETVVRSGVATACEWDVS